MRLAGATAFLAVIGFAVAQDNAAGKLDRDKLLQFVNEHGEIKPVITIEDWNRRRASILAAMQEIMGPLPGPEKRCPLDVKIIEEVDCGSYVRKLVSYQPKPGGRVPAYLLVSKAVLAGGRIAAAVFCLHPTDADLGHKVVVGLGGEPSRDDARELTLRGYVTLAPAYPHLANYQPDLKALGDQSGTMKAIWDNIRGLDFLATLPYVKQTGFGAIGHSLGGHNAIDTAAFDERIKVIVLSCGFDSYRDYAGRLHEIPVDFPEMLGVLAPRVTFVNAPLRDTNFHWQSVDRGAASARDVLRLYDQSANLMVEHPDTGHEFPNELREEAYRMFDRALR